MNITIEMIPSYSIAFIRSVGPYGLENKKIMEQLKDWARNNNLLKDDAIVLGIAQDDPNKTRPEQCRYDTCLVVDHDLMPDSDFVYSGNITGGKYCIFKIEHTAEAVQKTWSELFQELQQRNYRLDDSRPIMERYRLPLLQNHFCEICVPIV